MVLNRPHANVASIHSQGRMAQFRYRWKFLSTSSDSSRGRGKYFGVLPLGAQFGRHSNFL